MRHVERPNLELAITAWKTLWLEARNNQYRFDFVWQPTKELLEKPPVPKKLLCFTGKPYMFPDNSDGVVLDVFFTKDDCAAYLGTLFNRMANVLDRGKEIANIALVNIDQAEKLASANLMAIIGDKHSCKIPTGADDFNIEVIETAIKRCLTIRAPQLKSCEIIWLNEAESVDLVQRIRKEAERTAKNSTREEYLLAVAQDELKLEIWE